MHGRNWTLQFQSTIDIVSFLHPESKDEIEKTKKIIIPLFNQAEEAIPKLSAVIDLFAAQCATKNDSIKSLLKQINTNMRAWTEDNRVIKRDKEKAITAYKQILSNKIDDTLQNTMLHLKKHLDETLKTLSSSISHISSALLNENLTRGFESIMVGFLDDSIKKALELRGEVDKAFETCKQRIEEYEKRLPDELRKNSILDVASEAFVTLPPVSSHYATTFGDKKKTESPKSQEQLTTIKDDDRQSPDSNRRSYCSIM